MTELDYNSGDTRSFLESVQDGLLAIWENSGHTMPCEAFFRYLKTRSSEKNRVFIYLLVPHIIHLAKGHACFAEEILYKIFSNRDLSGLETIEESLKDRLLHFSIEQKEHFVKYKYCNSMFFTMR